MRLCTEVAQVWKEDGRLPPETHIVWGSDVRERREGRGTLNVAKHGTRELWIVRGRGKAAKWPTSYGFSMLIAPRARMAPRANPLQSNHSPQAE